MIMKMCIWSWLFWIIQLLHFHTKSVWANFNLLSQTLWNGRSTNNSACQNILPLFFPNLMKEILQTKQWIYNCQVLPLLGCKLSKKWWNIDRETSYICRKVKSAHPITYGFQVACYENFFLPLRKSIVLSVPRKNAHWLYN